MIAERIEGASLEKVCTIFSTFSQKGIQGRSMFPAGWIKENRPRLARIILEDREAKRHGGRITKARQRYIANTDILQLNQEDASQAEADRHSREVEAERVRLREEKIARAVRLNRVRELKRLRRILDGETRRPKGVGYGARHTLDKLAVLDNRRAVLLDEYQVSANEAFLAPLKAKEAARARKFNRIAKSMDAEEARALASYLRKRFK